MATSSVKRTPTTESLVGLENENRAVYRTAVGKLLYMCQGRADIVYSVKETESDGDTTDRGALNQNANKLHNNRTKDGVRKSGTMRRVG